MKHNDYCGFCESTPCKMINLLKDCQFCGKTPDNLDMHDVIYPTGTYWKPSKLGRRYGKEYFSRHDKPDDAFSIYGVHCTDNHGGCGAQITGDTFEDAVAKWNRRANE